MGDETAEWFPSANRTNCVICGDAWEKQELHRLCEDCIEKYGVRDEADDE